MEQQGELDVLNCETGHIHIKFDKADQAEVEKARRIIGDMLKRGYAVFVEVDGKTKQVREFDPTTDDYIIDDDAAPNPEVTKGKRGRRRISMTKHKATGVAPIAGG